MALITPFALAGRPHVSAMRKTKQPCVAAVLVVHICTPWVVGWRCTKGVNWQEHHIVGSAAGASKIFCRCRRPLLKMDVASWLWLGKFKDGRNVNWLVNDIECLMMACEFIAVQPAIWAPQATGRRHSRRLCPFWGLVLSVAFHCPSGVSNWCRREQMISADMLKEFSTFVQAKRIYSQMLWWCFEWFHCFFFSRQLLHLLLLQELNDLAESQEAALANAWNLVRAELIKKPRLI